MPEVPQPVQPGDPLEIQASTWNQVRKLAGPPAPNMTVPQIPGGSPLATYIRIKNGSGADRKRGEILSWSGVLYDNDTNSGQYWQQPALDGKEPEFPEDHGQMAVLQEPIPDGKIGWCAIGGVTPAKVDIKDTSHTYAFLTDADATQLTSATSGHAKILHITDPAVGTKTCLLQLCNPQPVWQYSLTTAMSGGSGTADIWGLDDTDIGISATITDISEELEQESGDTGLCVQVGGNFYAVGGGGGEEHTTVTNIVDIRIDSSTNKFQYKTQDQDIVNAQPISDWTDWHTGTECSGG